jgi:hypothetical protein
MRDQQEKMNKVKAVKEKAELKKVEERRFEFHLLAEASRLKMI